MHIVLRSATGSGPGASRIKQYARQTAIADIGWAARGHHLRTVQQRRPKTNRPFENRTAGNRTLPNAMPKRSCCGLDDGI
ncbi:hypothetical protein HR51_21275 [Burkholderia cepacia]|nr:hypothetical protein HR51_21275 [Burkholderia cepacia]